LTSGSIVKVLDSSQKKDNIKKKWNKNRLQLLGMHTLKRKRKGTDDDDDDDDDDDSAPLTMYSLCKKLENFHRLKYFWFFHITKVYIGTLVKLVTNVNMVTKVTVRILRYGYLCNTIVSKASILTI